MPGPHGPGLDEVGVRRVGVQDALVVAGPERLAPAVDETGGLRLTGPDAPEAPPGRETVCGDVRDAVARVVGPKEDFPVSSRPQHKCVWTCFV